MPCYSRTPVRLTSAMKGLDLIQQAATELGLSVSLYAGGKSLEVTDRKTWTTVKYYDNGQTIECSSYDGESQAQALTLSVQKKYAENRIRQFAQEKGYNVVRGQRPGQFDLVQRVGAGNGSGGVNRYR